MRPDARAALEGELQAHGKLRRQIPERLREVLSEGSARAKIPPLTPHMLRHTLGTRRLQEGSDSYNLSKILGHSSVAVTGRHYAHALAERGSGGREPAGQEPNKCQH
jgi:integrase